MNNRLLKVRSLIKEKKLDALLVSSVSNIFYLTNFSFLSKDEREAYLFITPRSQYIITDGRYSESVNKQVAHFKLIEITHAVTFEGILQNLSAKNRMKKLGVEKDNLTVQEYDRIRKHASSIHHFSIDSLRAVKETREIELMKKACELSDKAFKHTLSKLKVGITEKELAFELELFFKKNEAEASFPPIVAFGKNSSLPHHQTGNQKLTRNSIVLLDLGAKLNGYCSDMTRTVFFGKPTVEQKKMYNIVLEAQKLAIEQLNNETMVSRIDKIAREHITSQNYPTIPHSLGHGIGLEVHEAPRLSPKSKDILKPGMVFSIEPGIYLAGVGGIRVEDLIVLEKSGPRLLTNSPRTLLTLFK